MFVFHEMNEFPLRASRRDPWQTGVHPGNGKFHLRKRDDGLSELSRDPETSNV
jgi:hypothetical protein